MKKLSSILFTSFILVGCGGGGSNDDTTNNANNFKKVDSIGYFEDAAIVGASYKCGNKTGITQNNGQFNYTTNEGCIFFIGNTILAKFNAKDLSEENVHAILPSYNAANLLYSLDEDSNINNGFNIDENKIPEILGDTSIDFSRELSSEHENYISNLQNINTDAILNHMQDRVKKMLANKTYYAYSGTQLFTISFNASLTTITINGNPISTKRFFNIIAIKDYTIEDMTIYEYFKLKSITNDTIVIEDNKDSQHFDIKFYTSKNKAKESIIHSNTIKTALEGKTLYQPSNDFDDDNYLMIYQFSKQNLNITDTYSNDIQTNAPYKIEDGQIIIPGVDNPTYNIVSYQKDKFIFALNSQTLEIEAFFYNKQDALEYSKEIKGSSEVLF